MGDGLGTVNGYQEVEPALVDPSLAVNLANPDTKGERLHYWPSYSEIPPESRAAYLQWLASGRQDPAVPTGYVFLFFYGLERRLLADTRNSEAAKHDASAITAEVERLLGIYGENGSFQRYATEFLAATRVLWMSDRLYRSPPLRDRVGYDLPVDLRVALGQLVVDGHPIAGPWAFAWFINHPEARLRTPAHRCAEEFEALFLHRFAEKFPNGMKLKPNKRRLKWEYRHASASFGGHHEIELGELPDVGAISRPVRVFQEIADSCLQELDAYSRYLGRNPNGEGSIEAFGLLPAELTATSREGEIAELVNWAEDRLGGQSSVLLSGAEIMSNWEHSKPDKMTKKEAIAFAHVLAKVHFGIEPDVRFVGPPLSAKGHAVLFRLAGGHDEAPSREYRSSMMLMHLAAIVAAADGVVSPDEERHLERHLEHAMHMNDSETKRLRTHLRWLLAEQPGMAGLKKRFEGIERPTRMRIAQFAVTVAGADGRIDSEEVKVLRKLYTMLGLEPDDVYGDIHALAGTPVTEPVTVRAGKPQAQGYAIPAPPRSSMAAGSDSSDSGFVLDMSRVRTMLHDTAEVASLLSDIFIEEQVVEPAREAMVAIDDSPDSVAGMDGPHSKLLRTLEGKEVLSRHAFEQLAEQMQLLPDGALDLLNEAAFETCDAPLLEGEDPIEIDSAILAEMRG